MKINYNGLVLLSGGLIALALLTSDANAGNVMPDFSQFPTGWGNSSGGIDIYSLNKINGFEGRDNVLEVIAPGAGSPSILKTVGGDHAVFGGVGSQLEAYLWVDPSWSSNTGPDGTVDTDMLGIMPLSLLPPTGVPEFDDWIYYPAIGFSNESGVGKFKVWDASRESETDPGPTYGCNINQLAVPTLPNPLNPCWVYLDGTATDRGGDTVPNAPVYYNNWNKLTIDFTPEFNIVYSVNDVPVYTAILDVLTSYNDTDINNLYGMTTVQMIAQDSGTDYIAHWANIPEPPTYALAAIGWLAAFGVGKRRHTLKKSSS